MAKSSGNNRYLRRGGSGGGLPGRSSMGGGATRTPSRRPRRCWRRPRTNSRRRSSKARPAAAPCASTMSGEQKITGITISPDVVDPGRRGDAAGPDHGGHRGRLREGERSCRRSRSARSPAASTCPASVSARWPEGAASTPEPIQRLIEAFHRLPGIGPEVGTAARVPHPPRARAGGRRRWRRRDGREAAHPALLGLREHHRVRPLPLLRGRPRATGRLFASSSSRSTCSRSSGRAAIGGQYHVLHGVLNPMDGIGPEDLHVRELVVRLQAGESRK